MIAAAAVAACTLAALDVAYVQRALDRWSAIVRDHLALPSEPLPWMVLFDRRCAYHLAADPAQPLGREGQPLDVRITYEGAAVPVRAIPLADAVAVPSGARLPIAGIAFTSLYGDEGREKPFYVTALPDVWAHDPKYTDRSEDWGPFVLEVLSHELVHTRQLVGLMRRLAALKQTHPILPSTVDDDWLQKTFTPTAPGLDATVRAEVELFHQAAAEPDVERGRQLARTALALLHARRATYYGTEAPAYAAMEDVFLNMEGVACWSAFTSARAQSPTRTLDAFRGNRKFWSQEEGLALFLVLDRFAAGWKQRVFPPELASPVALLEEALGPSPR